MNKNLETIRRACIAANKSILDLCFGAQIRWGNNTNWKVIFITGDEDWDTFTIALQKYKDVQPEIFKKDPANRTRITLESSGEFILIQDNGMKYIETSWNLRDDDLNNNPQCWDFIAEILK